MLKSTALAGLVVGLLGAMPLAAAAAPIVTAQSASVLVGDTFSIDITVTDAADLTSWQFDLSFDPAIVTATNVTEGPFLAAFGTTLTPPTLFGSGVMAGGSIFGVTNSFVDLPPNPSGDGVLATIQFIALAPGVSPLALTNAFVNLSTDVTAVDGTITVSALIVRNLS